MDEAFLILLAGAFLLAVPAALVLALVAWSRSRRVLELERRLAALERGARQPVHAAAARPSAVPTPEARPQPAPAARPIESVEPPPPREPLETLPPKPAPAPVRPAAEPARAPARARIDWERFLGVRGAAVVGGLVLALAGLLFVQHSIQQGWITPALRVWIALGTGVAALAASQPLWSRGYRHAGNALSGAGGVLLFGGLWAGFRLYGLFGFAFAFALMVLVSVVLAFLALRRPSKVVAVFGVLGGFATPLLVTLGADHPLGLFGYLLVLDVGLFALARRRGWGLLGVLGSLGSIAVFASWLGLAFEAEVAPWALGFVALSSAALCLPALFARGEGERPPLAGAAVALTGSFPLALFVAARADFGPGLLPLAAVAAVLLALAAVVARRGRFPALAAGGALGVLALMLAWSLAAPLTVVDGWQFLGVTLVLGLIAHAPLEFDRRAGRTGREVHAGAPALLELGLAGIQVSVLARTAEVHPLAVLGWALLPALLLLRQSWLTARASLAASAALPAGALALVVAATGGAALARPLDAWFSIALVAVPLLFALHALLIRPDERRASSWLATSLVALFGLCSLWLRAHALRAEPLEFAAAAVGLMAVGAHAAGRGASSARMLAPVVVGALLAWHWSALALALEGHMPLVLALVAAAPLAVALGPRVRDARAGPWIVAALAPLAWQPALLRLAFDNAGRGVHTLVPLAAAAVALLVAARARTLPAELPARGHTLAAAAITLSIGVALAPSMWLERGHFATPFLAGFGMFLAWRVLRHRGLAIAAVVAFALLGLPGALFETGRTTHADQGWERSGWPVVHWMSVLWLLPALLSGWAARGFARAGPSVRRAAVACGVISLLTGFVWLNLEVQDLFNEGAAFEVATQRLPLRDFLTSCAWALYAFGLLLAGLRSDSGALRKASLVFLLAAVAKVFLHDLGTLTGLYRVGSLFGLALALFAVSLCYQRFVFARPRAAGPASEGARV